MNTPHSSLFKQHFIGPLYNAHKISLYSMMRIRVYNNSVIYMLYMCIRKDSKAHVHFHETETRSDQSTARIKKSKKGRRGPQGLQLLTILTFVGIIALMTWVSNKCYPSCNYLKCTQELSIQKSFHPNHTRRWPSVKLVLLLVGLLRKLHRHYNCDDC